MAYNYWPDPLYRSHPPIKFSILGYSTLRAAVIYINKSFSNAHIQYMDPAYKYCI